MAKTKKDTQVLTVRMPADLHRALKVVAMAMDTSVNDIVVRAVGGYLADEGHRRAVERFSREAREEYRVALDKLADL
jgi:predicted transcriptional regulator